MAIVCVGVGVCGWQKQKSHESSMKIAAVVGAAPGSAAGKVKSSTRRFFLHNNTLFLFCWQVAFFHLPLGQGSGSFFFSLLVAAAWRHLAQTTVIMIKLDYGCFPFFTPTSHQIQQCSEQRAAQFSVLAVLFPDLPVQLPPPASSLSRPHLRPSSEFQFMAHPMWEFHAGVCVCVLYK